jgi:hypothetical protein
VPQGKQKSTIHWEKLFINVFNPVTSLVFSNSLLLFLFYFLLFLFCFIRKTTMSSQSFSLQIWLGASCRHHSVCLRLSAGVLGISQYSSMVDGMPVCETEITDVKRQLQST